MKFTKTVIAITFFAVLASSPTAASDYEVTVIDDGPFSFEIRGIKLNQGSTLSKQGFLLNAEDCPVSISDTKTSINYVDRGFRFQATTSVIVDRPVVAMRIRTVLFNAFGQHMMNLRNTVIEDFGEGATTLDTATWRASETDVSEHLSSVTFVSRVRFADGTQWAYDEDDIEEALRSLQLEEQIADD